MRSRLALLVSGSGQWDPKRGAPAAGDVDALIHRYSQRSGFLKGWEDVFLRHGVQIEVAGVEDVRIEKAGSLPFFDELHRHGIGANDRVPSTCLLWIRLIHTEKRKSTKMSLPAVISHHGIEALQLTAQASVIALLEWADRFSGISNTIRTTTPAVFARAWRSIPPVHRSRKPFAII